METPIHEVFISYHHKDQMYKDEMVRTFNGYAFIDASVDIGGVDENLPDQTIRTIIRDGYLRDSSVTIVLVGDETKNRKHIDWEIYSSMYDGAVNKKSGILIVNLPTIFNAQLISICDEDKEILGRNINWTPIQSYEQFDYMPARLIDNIRNPSARICAANYNDIIGNPQGLRKLIDIAYNKRSSNQYDLSRPMRRQNRP